MHSFFVESAGGDVESALSTYYETEGAGGEGQGDEAEVEGEETDAAPPESTGPRTLSGQPAPAEPTNWASQAAPSSGRRQGTGFSAGGGVATLSNIQDRSGPAGGEEDSDDSDDDAKGPANFFTGGERSGLNVQNPDHRPGRNAPEVVQNILKKAAEAGQKQPDDETGAPGRTSSSSSSRKPAAASRSFAGPGRTINDEQAEGSGREEEQAPRMRSGPPGGRGAQAGAGDEDGNEDEEEVAIRNITFWQDGFSIANGPLCRYDDPQHAETLALINTNRAPLSLLNVRFGQPVELRVERRTNEKYQPPPPEPMKPFGGHGNRLGAPVPDMTVAATGPVQSQQVSPPTAAPPTSTMFQVDASQPTTQVQIRLGDGQRMVARLNHTHTVADVRQYINASHPGMSDRPYTLQSSFPPKPLTDETMTLKDAGLVNAVIILKWT